MNNIEKQYQTSQNLNTRISIHDKYSTNKQPFGNWILSHYEIRPGMKILELGCGTGSMWKENLHLLHGSELTLTDFSHGMLETAKQNICAENVNFAQVDIQDIPYPDGAFDAVIANMMLYHVPDVQKALWEVSRVLKKGGHLIAPTFIYRDQAHKTAFSIRLMEKFGFVTFHKWTEAEYVSFVRKHGFPDALFRCISSKPMQECVITAQKEG